MRMALAVQMRLLLAAVPPAAAVFFLGPNIFNALFGPEWKSAGEFASLLAPALLFQLTSAPLVQLFTLSSRQGFYLLINALRALGLTAILVLTIEWQPGTTTFVTIYSAYLSLFYLSISAFIALWLKQGLK